MLILFIVCVGRVFFQMVIPAVTYYINQSKNIFVINYVTRACISRSIFLCFTFLSASLLPAMLPASRNRMHSGNDLLCIILFVNLFFDRIRQTTKNGISATYGLHVRSEKYFFEQRRDRARNNVLKFSEIISPFSLRLLFSVISIFAPKNFKCTFD